MDLNLIRKLVKIVDTSGITDLEIEEDGIKIKVAKKSKNSQSTVLPQTVIQTEPAVSTSPSATAEKEKLPAVVIPSENLHEIKSPIVGTFYRAPAPDADAYIQVSDSVSSGTVLCIIEAMKLMNEIECDINGKVVKILAENGQPVEYNQPLFLIEPS